MPIRNRAVTDTKNPPGQVRYLRDMIKKYQEEDRRVDDLNLVPATTPSPGTENVVERLREACLKDVSAFSQLEGCQYKQEYEWQMGRLHAARKYLSLLENSGKNTT